jgi:hypothetical protein
VGPSKKARRTRKKRADSFIMEDDKDEEEAAGSIGMPDVAALVVMEPACQR